MEKEEGKGQGEDDTPASPLLSIFPTILTALPLVLSSAASLLLLILVIFLFHPAASRRPAVAAIVAVFGRLQTPAAFSSEVRKVKKTKNKIN